MIVIRGRNVHEIFPRALALLQEVGVRRESRNGPVIMFPEPVTTVYERPAERVIFYPERDANPFFHLYEALWMLGGRNDVASLARYVPRMKDYSDDGETFHGAYGYRWRKHFFNPGVGLDVFKPLIDQLPPIIEALKKNPDDRRQVLQMWDANSDLGGQGKDLPCNLLATFQVVCDGRLDMTVMNRSNDLIWGCYGANAVHFSVLHEYMSLAIGRAQGIYRQVSTNLHAYDNEVLAKVRTLFPAELYPYSGGVEPYPLMSTPVPVWEADLARFLDDETNDDYVDPFFNEVAAPMFQAHYLHKSGHSEDARDLAKEIKATDWRRACVEWLERRIERQFKKGRT